MILTKLKKIQVKIFCLLLITSLVLSSHKPLKVLGTQDAYGYTRNTSIGTAFIDISGTGTNTGITGDDDEANVVMPFEFDLYGTVSRYLRVGANGAILFDATSGNIDYDNVTFPSGANPLMIAPYWDDLVPSNGDIFYETQGTAPNRMFIVQWDRVDVWPTGGGDGTFEVILYEGTNNIDFVYDDTNFNGSDNDEGESATIGINRDGSVAELNTFNNDNNSAQGGDAIRFTHPNNSIAKSYVSSTTIQEKSGIGVAVGATIQQILKMEVKVAGNNGTLNLTRFDFNTTGTTNPGNDIQNARVYYNGTSPDFSSAITFGSAVANPNGTFSMTGTRNLVNGTNYFWLTYDIKGGATDGNFVDAQCTSITVGSAKTPTVTAPSGNREIGGANGYSCSGAYSITPVCGNTVTVTGSTIDGDTNVNPGCVATSNNDEKIWYTFTGNGSNIVAETIDIGDPNLNDTQLWVYSGTCGGMVCVTGNDDTAGLFSRVTFNATEGVTYFIVVGEYDNPTNPGAFQLAVTFDATMTYTSSTTTQNTSSTIQSAIDQNVIGIEVVTSNSCDPVDLTSLTFNTTGSTNATTDIDNAKVYYTGTSATFATVTQLGTAQVSPNGSFTVNGFTQQLSEGTNYFWLAYDIAAGAIDGDVVDAQCTSITVNGSTQTPTIISPNGSKLIQSDLTVLRGNQLSFDGGDYLEAVGYTGITGSANRTVEMWARHSGGANEALIQWGNDGGNRQRWRIETRAGGVIRVNIRSANISTSAGTNFVNISDNNWHHIAVVLNGTTLDDINIYIDGLLQNKSTNTAIINTASSANLTIGSRTGTNAFFNGEMDEVRLWDVARTQDEIRENMHITLTGTEPNLVSYWQFNESSGTTFSDVTGNHSLTRGNGVTASTFPTIETSTVAVAGGVSNLQTVNSTGSVSFTGTDITLNFTVAPSTSSEFVVSKLTGEDAPGNLPIDDIGSLNTVTPIYWVVNAFGATGYTTEVTFNLGSSAISADDEATPTNLKLISRASNSYGAWSSVKDAGTASEATGVVTFNGVTTFSQLKVGTINDSPLPITLKSFDGYVENGKNYLEWVTSSEINNDRFELEKSSDGVSYVKIAEITGSGTTEKEHSYNYLDKSPYLGKNYYRLKQIDFDGKFEYANKIVLLEDLDNIDELQFSISSNPTNGLQVGLVINTKDFNREIWVTIYNIYGGRQYEGRIEPNELAAPISIELYNKLKSGVYLVVLEQGDHRAQSKLLIDNVSN